MGSTANYEVSFPGTIRERVLDPFCVPCTVCVSSRQTCMRGQPSHKGDIASSAEVASCHAMLNGFGESSCASPRSLFLYAPLTRARAVKHRLVSPIGPRLVSTQWMDGWIGSWAGERRGGLGFGRHR